MNQWRRERNADRAVKGYLGWRLRRQSIREQREINMAGVMVGFVTVAEHKAAGGMVEWWGAKLMAGFLHPPAIGDWVDYEDDDGGHIAGTVVDRMILYEPGNYLPQRDRMYVQVVVDPEEG